MTNNLGQGTGTRRRWLRLVAVVLVALVAMQLAPQAVYARSLADITAEIEAKKQVMNQLEADITANKSNRAAAEKALGEYQTQYNELLVLITEKEEAIQVSLADLDFKTAQISNTMEAISQSRAGFEERLRAIYDINSSNAMMSALLTVSSFAELVQTADAMQRVSEQDTAMLEKLARQKEAFETQKTELEGVIASLNEQLAALQADRDWCNGKMEEMRRLIASANYNIQLKEGEVDATQAEIKALQEEYARIFKQLQQKGSKAGDGSVRYAGNLVWPTSGIATRVSSWFGSPRSNTGYHYGIDMPGPVGTHILAAASGTVITSEWHYSYGYYIVVDHGQGFRTLYAHCSALHVGAGTPVGAGETIAAMGNTGNSYGSHLHFEVHEHGTRQNPALPEYLGIFF